MKWAKQFVDMRGIVRVPPFMIIMEKPLSLRKNFTWAFIGNIVSAFCMWLLLVVLAKLGRAETIGVFSVAQAVGLPISMLLSLKLLMVQVTDAKNDFSFGHYYALRIITAITAVVTTLIVGIIFYSSETLIVITMLGFNYAVVSVREINLGLMQKHERMDCFAISTTLQGILSLLMFASLYYFSRNLPLSITGLICARIVVAGFYDYPTTHSFVDASEITRPKLDSQVWRLAKTSMPLGLVAGITSLFTSVPRLVLNQKSGTETLGYFTAISSFLVAATMFTAAVGQTVSPRLSRYFVDNIQEFRRLLYKLLGIGFIIGTVCILIVMVAGKQILTIMFTPDYAKYNHIFIGIALAGFILTLFTFMVVGINAARIFRSQLIIYTAALGICTVASLLFVPYYGMMGAVIALCLCYATGFFGCLYYLFKALKKHPISISFRKNKGTDKALSLSQERGFTVP